MRLDPIDPAELRNWLIAKKEAWKKAAESLTDPEMIKAQYLGVDTLEVVRQEFLDDLSFYDVPTDQVVERSKQQSTK